MSGWVPLAQLVEKEDWLHVMPLSRRRRRLDELAAP
jgi:hypothetical protein